MNKKLITYLVSFAAFFGPFTQSIYTPLLPVVQQEFRASEFMVNLTISIFTFVLAVMQLIYGPLTDSLGRRRVLLPGVLVFVAASVGAAFATTINVFLLFRVLQAAGMAVGSVVATTVIGDLYEGKQRGRAMGTFQTLVALGPAAGPVIGGFVGQYFGFHGVFWVLAGTGALLWLLNYRYLPETKPDSFSGDRFHVKHFAKILTRPTGTAIVALGFVQYYSFYNFLVFLPLLLTQFYGLTPGQNGLVFLPMSLMVVTGSLVGGRIQEYFNPRKLLLSTGALNVVATLLFVWLSPISLPVLIGSISFFGLCLGLSLPVQTTLLTNEFQHSRATAIGIYNFFRYLGMGAGPLVGTFFYHIGNRVEFIFAGFLFGATLVYAAVQFTRPRQPAVEGR